MWCTRWYLPLLLLPLPTAPPYFLILFLLSLTLHARPCFYCIILLATLFVSSCYWQPFPTSNPLSTPWADNITTFADALSASLPQTDQSLPAVMHVADRCWCDFSGSFFEPFNVSHWERVSVDRFKADLERRQHANEMARQALVDTATADQPATKQNETPSKVPLPAAPTTPPSPRVGGTIWSRLEIFCHRYFESLLPSDPPLPDSGSSHDPLPTNVPGVRQTVPFPATQEKHPLFRREYDLRPYGLDIVIDFGWTR